MVVPNPPHALSGHNPTLFNVVVQYADMDMLRALVLTSRSLYGALQKCHFNHLTMVVLEAPILDARQQILYNDAGPVPNNTIQITTDDIVAIEPRIGKLYTTPPLFRTQRRYNLSHDGVLDAWWRRCAVGLHLDYNLVIPDYARNFMARAQSVELAVYRPRLGTLFSTFFNNNAHHLKYGGHTPPDDCTSCACVGSNCHKASADSTSKHKLHLPCLTTSHGDTDDGEGVHDNDTGSLLDSGCVFSKYRSHRHPNDDTTKSHHLSNIFLHDRTFIRDSPYDGLPPFRIELRDTVDLIMVANVMIAILCLTIWCVAFGPVLVALVLAITYILNLYIPSMRAWCPGIITAPTQCVFANGDNTFIYHPRFQNLPHADQRALTTSLKIRVHDCVSFGAGDWCNAMPGCTIQPVQTCTIRDRHIGGSDKSNINIAGHFPHLTSLVLDCTHLNETNGCGIDGFDATNYVATGLHTRLSYFFIGTRVRLPHLQHFGVIGTLLEPCEYAAVARYNELVTSLNINPGLQPNSDAAVSTWMDQLSEAFDELELEHDYAQRRPQHQTTGPLETTEPKHKPCPQRKYDFSTDIADTCLGIGSCCPHKTNMLMQRALDKTSTVHQLVRPLRQCSRTEH